MKQQNSLLTAGAMLAISGIVVKAVSAAYRIPLTRMLGADTMGRYSAVFSLFMPFYSFATAGITTSVAHFTARYTDSTNGQKSVKDTAFKLYMLVSVIVTLAFVAFGKFYSEWQQDSVFFYGSVILAPSIVLAVVEHIYEGITQGQMNMMPTATANLLESIVKTVVGVLGVWLVVSVWHSGDIVALAVCFASVTLAGLLCALYLFFLCRSKVKVQTEKTKDKISVKEMFDMSVPVGISALLMSLSAFFDTTVCLPKIAEIPYADIVKSFDKASFIGAGDMAMYLFGIWQGMVLSVFNLTPAIVSSVGVASLPILSKSWAITDRTVVNNQTKKLFRVTSFISVPCILFVSCFAADIIGLLFGTTPQQSLVASQLVHIACIGGVFCCFGSVFNSVLYAAGRSKTVFRILLSASIIRAVVSWLLCGVPNINIKAFAVSSSVFYTIIFILSIYTIKKLGISFNFLQIFTIPLLAGGIAVFLTNYLSTAHLQSLPLFLSLSLTGVIFGAIYMLIILSTGFLVDK